MHDCLTCSPLSIQVLPLLLSTMLWIHESLQQHRNTLFDKTDASLEVVMLSWVILILLIQSITNKLCTAISLCCCCFCSSSKLIRQNHHPKRLLLQSISQQRDFLIAHSQQCTDGNMNGDRDTRRRQHTRNDPSKQEHERFKVNAFTATNVIWWTMDTRTNKKSSRVVNIYGSWTGKEGTSESVVQARLEGLEVNQPTALVCISFHMVLDRLLI